MKVHDQFGVVTRDVIDVKSIDFGNLPAKVPKNQTNAAATSSGTCNETHERDIKVMVKELAFSLL